MQVKKIAAVLAIATLASGAAMADAITDSGLVLSAPSYDVSASVFTRSEVQAQAAQAVRASIADPIVAEGFRQQAPVLVGQRSREAVQAEARQAARQAYATSAQINAGNAS
ncbi:MAG: hypothetical protein KA795_06285 [Burkholderiaceae bacterium]|nr:hypothetical protein [Burkholderiaceae bacterium]